MNRTARKDMDDRFPFPAAAFGHKVATIHPSHANVAHSIPALNTTRFFLEQEEKARRIANRKPLFDRPGSVTFAEGLSPYIVGAFGTGFAAGVLAEAGRTFAHRAEFAGRAAVAADRAVVAGMRRGLRDGVAAAASAVLLGALLGRAD